MCHVLIIEDEQLVAISLREMLVDHGATSFSFAETESDAIKEAELRPPGVILSDVMLRQGRGPDAVATIRERLGPIPVMYLTATPEKCNPIPEDAPIITKPYMASMVVEAFRALTPRGA